MCQLKSCPFLERLLELGRKWRHPWNHWVDGAI